MSLPFPAELKSFPKGFSQLCNEEVIGLEQCMVVFLHTSMLETGYISKDVDEQDIYRKMPENWRQNNVYSLCYYHKTIPNIFCNIKCVSLPKKLAIHGLLEDETDEENSVCLSLNVTDLKGLSIDTEKLSIDIKDRLCFPLLVLLQRRINFKPLFGLSGLISDCKVDILKHLNLKSVVSMSQVNKEFHNLTNSPHLWKCLFNRDFELDISSNENPSGEDWKMIYRTQYLKRRRIAEVRQLQSRPRRQPAPSSYPLPPHDGFREDLLYPGFQLAFPNAIEAFHPIPHWWSPARRRHASPFDSAVFFRV